MPLLATLPPKPRWQGSRALVVIPPDQCPACGSGVTHENTHQPALLRHGGYGASLKRTLRVCTNDACRWTCEIQSQETRP